MPLFTIPIHEFNHCHDREGQFCSSGDEPWTMTKAEFITRRGADAPVEREDFARYHLSKVAAGEPGLSVESGTLDGRPIRKVVFRNATGQPIGVTTLRTAAGDKVIDDTAVHPDYRRQGVATKLYRKAAELGHTTGWAENVGSAGVKHKLAVTDALQAGKTVPAHVLADYPDLRKKRRVREFNTCHTPAGTASGGQFCGTELTFHVREKPHELRVMFARPKSPGEQGGYITVTLPREKGQPAQVDTIILNSDLRRKGYGHQLYLRAAEEVKKRGYSGLSSLPRAFGGSRSMYAERAWRRLVKTGRVRAHTTSGGFTHQVLERRR
jgi:GNAT superfamily N-acetyltransferase